MGARLTRRPVSVPARLSKGRGDVTRGAGRGITEPLDPLTIRAAPAGQHNELVRSRPDVRFWLIWCVRFSLTPRVSFCFRLAALPPSLGASDTPRKLCQSLPLDVLPGLGCFHICPAPRAPSPLAQLLIRPEDHQDQLALIQLILAQAPVPRSGSLGSLFGDFLTLSVLRSVAK